MVPKLDGTYVRQCFLRRCITKGCDVKCDLREGRIQRSSFSFLCFQKIQKRVSRRNVDSGTPIHRHANPDRRCEKDTLSHHVSRLGCSSETNCHFETKIETSRPSQKVTHFNVVRVSCVGRRSTATRVTTLPREASESAMGESRVRSKQASRGIFLLWYAIDNFGVKRKVVCARLKNEKTSVLLIRSFVELV
jgi:hypothetical protein